jgi:Zn-dependent protease
MADDEPTSPAGPAAGGAGASGSGSGARGNGANWPPPNGSNWPPNGAGPAPRQHAYRDPSVAGPGGPGGPGGQPPQGQWGAQRAPGRPAGGARRAGFSPRRVIWIIAIVAVVVILLRSHRITQTEVIWFCILIPSLILHEISHGWVALMFGDDTAKRAGRLSLNPIRHVDPIGTLLVPAIMVLSGWGFFGWAKPVPVTVGRLRSPRNQGVLVSLAGPCTNIVLAALSGLLFYYLYVAGGPHGGTLSLRGTVIFDVGLVNLWVAFFNLIPIPPLDGSAVLERLLPAAWWPQYLRIRPYGLFVIFGGLLLLGMARIYPLSPIFSHLEQWWGTLLHVRVV